jgi:hypothetical protein
MSPTHAPGLGRRLLEVVDVGGVVDVGHQVDLGATDVEAAQVGEGRNTARHRLTVATPLR